MPQLDEQYPPNKPLGPVPRQGFGLNAAFQANPNTGAEAGLGVAAAPAGPNAAIAPTAQQVVPQLSPTAQGTTPSPTPTPPTNFNINDLVAPISPLAQATRTEQNTLAASRNAGVTGLPPGPPSKQIFENREYRDTQRAGERYERQGIKQRLRDNAASY